MTLDIDINQKPHSDLKFTFFYIFFPASFPCK